MGAAARAPPHGGAPHACGAACAAAAALPLHAAVTSQLTDPAGRVAAPPLTPRSEVLLLDCDNVPFAGAARRPAFSQDVHHANAAMCRNQHRTGAGQARTNQHRAPHQGSPPPPPTPPAPADPARLFDDPDYRAYGNLFWPDFWAVAEKRDIVFDMVGLEYAPAQVGRSRGVGGQGGPTG